MGLNRSCLPRRSFKAKAGVFQFTPAQLSHFPTFSSSDFLYSNIRNRVVKQCFVHMAKRRYLAGHFVGDLLYLMPGVALSPFPGDIVLRRSSIKLFPPILIRLSFPGTTHRLNYVTRI